MGEVLRHIVSSFVCQGLRFGGPKLRVETVNDRHVGVRSPYRRDLESKE